MESTAKKSEICSCIRAAMERACSETYIFTENEARTIDAEYLFTVNVAQAIASKNDFFGSPYRIMLERQTKAVSMDCLPLLTNVPVDGSKLKRSILRKNVDVTRSGRIDITVYADGNSFDAPPLCVIELKKFDPQPSYVEADLARNSDYFFLQGETGASRIQFSCFAAMYSFDTSTTESEYQRERTSISERYSAFVNNVPRRSELHAGIDVFTVSKAVETRMEHDDVEVLESNHHFVGVIVTFERLPSKAEGP